MSIRNLQYVSDIHLERKIGYPKLVRKENNIALLGDIGNPFKDNYKDFLSYASDRWENVFLLAGNHEYWQERYNYYEVNDKINDVVSRFDNVFFLNNMSSTILSDYVILGTTLWSHITSPSRILLMGDDIKIDLLDKTFNDLHSQSVHWLKKEIYLLQNQVSEEPANLLKGVKEEKERNKEKEIVVLSHHLPSYKMIVEKYSYGFYSKYHDRFASHLDDMIQPPISYWFCGHSHCVLTTKINGVYCGINSYHN